MDEREVTVSVAWLWWVACASDPGGAGAGESDLRDSVVVDSSGADTGSDTGSGVTLADRVVLDAVVHTMDPDQPIAEALATSGGALVYVGDALGAQAFIGPDTDVVSLEGQVVLPGLHDSHIHLLEAFHEAGGTCIVPTYVPLFTLVDEIEACAPNQVGTDSWVLGWGFSIFDALFEPDPKGILDRAVPDRPIAIMEVTSHAAWVNSEALRVLGIDETTPDPPGGVIMKGDDGRPNGLLLDAAGELAFDTAFARNDALDVMNEQAILAGQAAAHAVGITSVADARAYLDRGHVEAWRAVHASGDLTLRTQVGLWASPTADDDSQLAELKALYDNDPEARLRFGQVKLYTDGLLQMTTAALLEPYESPFVFASPTGLEHFDPLRLQRYVRELQEVGFDMHVHAIGDRGVRQTLDAFELAQSELGPARHRVTHVEYVHPDDLPRFAQLGVTADPQMSAPWVLPHRLDENAFFVGEQRVRDEVWRLGDLWDSGANVVLSSDYDVGDLSPFPSMARALDRGDQSLPSVQATLEAYTVNAAYLLRQEERVGSLTVGRRADWIVVDRDPFTTSDLAGTQVLWTVVDDEVVHAVGELPPQ